MNTVQVKQFSGLINYINVLKRNFYTAGQKLPQEQWPGLSGNIMDDMHLL